MREQDCPDAEQLGHAAPFLPRRQLWLYVGVYDFAGLQAQAPPAGTNGRSASFGAGARWPPEWRAALGRVAAVTPLLIVGWEQSKPDEMLENLSSEFGSRLAKLGSAGTPAALMAALQAVLGPGTVGPQLPAPMVGQPGSRAGWSGRVGVAASETNHTLPPRCPPHPAPAGCARADSGVQVAVPRPLLVVRGVRGGGCAAGQRAAAAPGVVAAGQHRILVAAGTGGSGLCRVCRPTGSRPAGLLQAC